MTTYYVDPTVADDTGAGTLAAPKKSLRAARAVASAGDTILLRANYIHDPSQGQFFNAGNVARDLKIATYGSGDRPILDGLTYDNPGSVGWTHVGSGVWKKTFGAWYIRRVFVASTNNGILLTSRVVGPAVKRAAPNNLQTVTANPTLESDIISALSPSRPWFGAGAAFGFALYMYTGSSTVNPSDYYSGIAILQADGVSYGAIEHISLQTGVGSCGISAKDLVLRGPGLAGIRYLSKNANGADQDGGEYSNILVTHAFFNAILVRGTNEDVNPYVTKNISFNSVSSDFCSNLAEQELTTAESYYSGAGDAVSIGSFSSNICVSHGEHRNPYHVGIAIGSDNNGQAPCVGSRIYRVKVVFDTWTTYSRGMATYTGSSHVIDRCEVVGQNVRSQFAGGVRVTNSIWRQCKPSNRKPGTDQWVASEAYYYDTGAGSTDAIRYIPIWPVNVVIQNNTAEGAFAGNVAQLNSYSNAYPVGGPLWPNDAFSMINNLIVLTGTSTTVAMKRTSGGGNAAPVQVDTALIKNVYVTSGSMTVINNGTSYPLATAPGASGCLQGNFQLFNLTPADASISWAGSPTAYRGSDIYGQPRPIIPTVGAIEIPTYTAR